MIYFQCAVLVMATLAWKNLALVMATEARDVIHVGELAVAARANPLPQWSSCVLASGRCCLGMSTCVLGAFFKWSERMGARIAGLVPLLSRQDVSFAREARPRHVADKAV